MADISTDLVARTARANGVTRRLPVGVGLTVGACAALAIWTLIGFGLHALLA